MATTQPVVRQRRVVERRRLCEEDATQTQQPAGANEEGGGPGWTREVADA
jgi:hypothetical protein